MQKSLELMNLKLTNVIGDGTGVTGLKIIRAILAGERDAQTLAKLRDRRCKRAEPEIATALEGRYRPEHLSELRSSLTMWEKHLDVIAELDDEIAAHLRVMKRRSEWPTVKQFASWLGLCPQFKKTGGKVKSSKTRKGKNRAATALRLAAWGLMRSKSYLGAYLRRQRARLGAPKAITATAHKLARVIYNIMRFGVEYMKRDEEAYAEQVRDRQEKQLHRRAKELGFEVTKKVDAPTEPAPSPAAA